jgi:tetratricopeptide (TPR) repeat protein
LRLSPFDPWRATALFALAIAQFHLGHCEEAAAAAHKAIQSTPGFSISHAALAASLAKLGRLEEARAAAARVLELQPGFRYGQWAAAAGCAPALAVSLGEACTAAGLPE